MSRSFKKNKIIKDSPTWGKRLGNKMFRRKTKQMNFEDEDVIPINSKSEVINDWDVSDYRFFAHVVSELKGKNRRLNK